MKKEKLLLNEEIKRICELSGENFISGKHLVVVDIQPEYQDSIPWLHEFIDFLNENYNELNSLTFFYNGADTLGMIDLSSYQNWWYENGLEEEIAFDSNYYDKGYAFFRYCMDSGIDEDSVSNLVKHMIANGVNDSRELDEEFWDEFVERYGDEDVRDLLELADDCLWIPDLMEELINYNNIVLCGGGIYECLKEVEIALNALDKPFQVLNQFTY
jgi:hypothetical protein